MEQYLEDFSDVASLLGRKQRPLLELVEVSNIEWNDYDWAITISPKSSKKLSETCNECGQVTVGKSIEQQFELMKQLCDDLIKEFKDRISFFFRPEEYRDNAFLHYHGFLRSKYKSSNKIIKFISNYFNLDSKTLVKIKPIDNINGWKNYVYKDIYLIHDKYQGQLTGLQYSGYTNLSKSISKSNKVKTIPRTVIPNSLRHWYQCDNREECDICLLFYDKYKDKTICETL